MTNRLSAYIFIPKIWYKSYNAEFLSVCNEIRCIKYRMLLFLMETLSHIVLLVLIGMGHGGKMAITLNNEGESAM